MGSAPHCDQADLEAGESRRPIKATGSNHLLSYEMLTNQKHVSDL